MSEVSTLKHRRRAHPKRRTAVMPGDTARLERPGPQGQERER
jgi:hypothetical protein